MQISPDTMRLLMEMDAPADQKVALIKAMEADWLAYQAPAALNGQNEERERVRNESTYAERKRKKDRERRAAEREELRRLRESTATTPATTGEATATVADAPASSADPAPHTCAQVVIPSSSSLRSEEGIPPEKPSVSTPKGAKRGSKRVPTSWLPEAKTLTVLEGEGYSPGDLERALTRMRDHEFRTPRVDWDAAFRNWVRNERPSRHERPHHDTKFERRQANLARAFASPGRAAGQRWEP